MLFVLQCIAVALIALALLFLKGFKIKRLFKVPIYYVCLGGDIGGRKPIMLKISGLVGAPDALFFNPLKMRLVVGELKSRHFKNTLTQYEAAQVTLYMGMCDKWYLLKPQAVFRFGNDAVVPIFYNRKKFKEIYKMRFAALRVLNS